MKNARLKAFGLALLVVLAFGAIAAEGAPAAVEHSFASEEESTIITGEGEGHQLVMMGKATECEAVQFAGVMSGFEANNITVHPAYSNCELAGIKVTTNTEGCVYVFGSDTTITQVEAEHAAMTIECEEYEVETSESQQTATEEIAETEETAGIKHIEETDTIREEEAAEETEHLEETIAAKHKKVHTVSHKVKVLSPFCTISFEEQSIDGLTFENQGSGSTADIAVISTMSGIKYEALGLGCGLVGLTTGTHVDGAYEGVETLRGYQNEGVEGVTTKGLGGMTFNEGAHVGIAVTTP